MPIGFLRFESILRRSGTGVTARASYGTKTHRGMLERVERHAGVTPHGRANGRRSRYYYFSAHDARRVPDADAIASVLTQIISAYAPIYCASHNSSLPELATILQSVTSSTDSPRLRRRYAQLRYLLQQVQAPQAAWPTLIFRLRGERHQGRSFHEGFHYVPPYWPYVTERLSTRTASRKMGA